MKPRFLTLLACTPLLGPAAVRASTSAYGSINNFDAVNDTGKVCHGFEIEVEDLHSTEVTYTFEWNHYGTPEIHENNTIPAYPVTTVRYLSKKNPDGSWASYTAIPSAPINPTDGHQFTNPAVNFGGGHFGMGYRVPPIAVRYHWLVEDGAGGLTAGPPVLIATPFAYAPPMAGAVAAVLAVIQPPEPSEVPVLEFGVAVWVKEIRTTTHNDAKVKLRDLISDDPDDGGDWNWRNNEPDEVEIEWQLLQTGFSKANGGENGKLAGAAEGLEDGDETVTRRYEFYRYTGPLDGESGEAKASKVGPDHVHGVGQKEINGVRMDLSTVKVVGEFTGAQMAAVAVVAGLGLIDHLQDGVIHEDYPDRTIVVAGNAPFTVTTSGQLPQGMSFDTVTGVLSGTPGSSGAFSYTVRAREAGQPEQEHTYNFQIAAAGMAPPQTFEVETAALPLAGDTVSGGGLQEAGTMVTLTAQPSPGYGCKQWTEQGQSLSTSAVYTFELTVHHVLVAEFAPLPPALDPRENGQGRLEWPLVPAGWTLLESADLSAGNWRNYTGAASTVGDHYETTFPLTAPRRFSKLAPR